jgi:hypothetical protein
VLFVLLPQPVNLLHQLRPGQVHAVPQVADGGFAAALLDEVGQQKQDERRPEQHQKIAVDGGALVGGGGLFPVLRGRGRGLVLRR